MLPVRLSVYAGRGGPCHREPQEVQRTKEVLEDPIGTAAGRDPYRSGDGAHGRAHPLGLSFQAFGAMTEAGALVELRERCIVLAATGVEGDGLLVDVLRLVPPPRVLRQRFGQKEMGGCMVAAVIDRDEKKLDGA